MNNAIAKQPSRETEKLQQTDGEVPVLSEAQFPSRTPRMAFSVRETADTLGVSEKTVRRLVARRLLNPSRALRHLLISKKEVERFLEETAA